MFRCIARATHNPVLTLRRIRCCSSGASLRVIIDQVPQARARIGSAHLRMREAIRAQNEAEAQRWMERHIADFSRGYELAGIDMGLRLSL